MIQLYRFKYIKGNGLSMYIGSIPSICQNKPAFIDRKVDKASVGNKQDEFNNFITLRTGTHPTVHRDKTIFKNE